MLLYLQLVDSWTADIDQITEEVHRRFDDLSEEMLNWNPHKDKWSIAQVLEHLVIINRSYFQPLADLRAGSYNLPFLARSGFLARYFGRLVLKSVEPTTRRKTKTFPLWEPSKSHISKDVLIAFYQMQEELKGQIKASESLLRNGAIISSPANKYLFYRLEMAFDIIVTHERRHMEQVKELLDLLRKDVQG